MNNLLVDESNGVKFRPVISQKPTAEQIAKKQSWVKASDLEDSVSLVSVCSQRSPSVNKLSITFNKFAREVVHSEYGYVCKIPILNQVVPEDSHEVVKSKQKWDRYYIVLYSDNSIGICINEKVRKLLLYYVIF
jgi:predicted restriction endonuclease